MPVRAIERATGVTRGRVERALAKAATPSAADIPNRVRTADEFKGSIPIRARRRDEGKLSWNLETIRAARDAQMRGEFQTPVALARAMRTEGPLFVAYCNRIAPQSAVATRLAPCSGTRGATVARKATGSVFVPRSVLKGVQGTLANHGLAIGYNNRQTKADGTRVDFRLKEWPLEHVRWNNSEECLQTTTRDGTRVNIIHGDGDWTVFRKQHDVPWTQEAALLPAALLWAVLAGGLQDWAGASRSHGQPKLVGELPAGLALQLKNANGQIDLTPEALAFVTMLQDLVAGDIGAGIRPAGAKTDLLVNASTAWQVFSELRNSAEKIAARIYLGTDAILGSVGGAPGVDISALFGVASTILQGDFGAIEEGLNTGVYQPWTAVNYGDSLYSPSFEYLLPDPDAEQYSIDQAAKLDRLFTTLEKYAANNITVDQCAIDALCKLYRIDLVPQLGRGSFAVTAELAARALRISEIRQAAGYAPIGNGDERDDLLLAQLEARTAGNAAVAAADVKAQGAIEVAQIGAGAQPAPVPTP